MILSICPVYIHATDDDLEEYSGDAFIEDASSYISYSVDEDNNIVKNSSYSFGFKDNYKAMYVYDNKYWVLKDDDYVSYDTYTDALDNSTATDYLSCNNYDYLIVEIKDKAYKVTDPFNFTESGTMVEGEIPLTASITSKTYIYDNDKRIIGATFNGTASEEIESVSCGTANADEATIKDKSFSITTYFEEDKDIKLLVCSTSDKSVNLIETLTDVSSNNDPIDAKLYQDELDSVTEEKEDVIESEDFDVSVSGIPDDNTVEVGQTITFTIKSNIASKINALGQNSDGYVTEFTVSATENGFVTYTLVSEKGNEFSDTVYVGCFKSNEQSEYMDAWVDGGDESVLVQTGLFNTTSTKSLIMIWVTVILVAGVVTLVIYNKRKIGGKTDESK
jgi:hypothetical protein